MRQNFNIEEINQFLDKEDSEIVRATLQKSSMFFKIIVERYKNKLYGYIKRFTGLPSEDVEDILQEVFLLIYKNLNSFSNTFKFSTWAYTIAHNYSVNYLKKNRYSNKTYDLLDPTFSEILASEINIENETNKTLMIESIHKEILQLDFKYRSVLILRFVENKSYDEISDILKIPVGTVGTLINRGKSILKKRINKKNLRI